MTMNAPDTQAAPAGASGKTADDRATTFQAVDGDPEQHNGTTLLIEAYAVLWIILMTWLVLQWRKQAALNARLDGLERAIDRAAAKADGKK